MHDELLRAEGIELRNTGLGERKAKCPQCQHTRRKNPHDTPLSVRIEASGIKWHCHHCGYRGAKGDAERDGGEMAGGSRPRRGNRSQAWARKLREAQWW